MLACGVYRHRRVPQSSTARARTRAPTALRPPTGIGAGELSRPPGAGLGESTRGEHGHYSKDAEATSAQIKAGATIVLTTPVWDVNHLVQYLTDCRVPMDGNLNKLATIQPAVMPLHFGV